MFTNYHLKDLFLLGKGILHLGLINPLKLDNHENLGTLLNFFNKQ